MPTAPRPSARHAVLAAIATLLASLAVVVTVIDDDQNGRPDRVQITVKVDGPDQDTRRDDPLVLDQVAQAELQRADTATDQAGDTHRELAEPLREPTDTAPPGQLEGPLAAQEFPGCRTRFVQNYSSRRGADVRFIFLHQTVSRARGWASQDALTAMANRPSSGVSWHLLVAPETGYCTFTVPLNMKAWTQGNANPVAIGIEVERYGDEPTYVTGAGERKLVAILRELGRRFDIPMQKGQIRWGAGCQPIVVRPGILEHSDGGPCAGGHVDVTPWPTAPLITKAAAADTPSTATEKRRCRALTYHRRKVANGQGYWTPTRVRRVRYLRTALASAGINPARCR